MSWLKFDTTTPEKPEVLAITVRMGWTDTDLTVGKLLRVWRWFDQHTTDGNAAGVTPALLDNLIGVTGLAQALAEVGWLRILPGMLVLPNFDRHNGNSAKNRAETAARVATHRARSVETERAILPRPIRAAVFERDGRRCVYCSRQEGEYIPPEMKSAGEMHVDHVIPLTRGGSDDLRNLVAACRGCNLFKANRTPDECSLRWPVDAQGKRFGNEKSVTAPLPEKKREEQEQRKDGSGTRASARAHEGAPTREAEAPPPLPEPASLDAAEAPPPLPGEETPAPAPRAAPAPMAYPDPDQRPPVVVPEKAPVSSAAGALCGVLRAAGIGAVNPSNPTLHALIAAGCTAEDLLPLVPRALEAVQPFNYLLGMALGERQRAVKTAQQLAAALAAQECPDVALGGFLGPPRGLPGGSQPAWAARKDAAARNAARLVGVGIGRPTALDMGMAQEVNGYGYAELLAPPSSKS